MGLVHLHRIPLLSHACLVKTFEQIIRLIAGTFGNAGLSKQPRDILRLFTYVNPVNVIEILLHLSAVYIVERGKKKIVRPPPKCLMIYLSI